MNKAILNVCLSFVYHSYAGILSSRHATFFLSLYRLQLVYA
ncbi:MAG: hypothetical protein GPOALKHO_001659 [Sodalis sp.]|nr:MAG: hypothetical protein GPOALKHO_001659 [Sodalis sp.]